MLERFKEIFNGLEIAYGQTKHTENFSENGKHQTRSITIKQPPTDNLWQDHLDGKEPALGIVPIRQDSKCKWGCIDIDTYPFNHKNFIKKIRDKNLPLILFRSKSGGAHTFLFTKEYVPASLMRDRLKKMASVLGFAKAEIFPKQDYLRADRGDTGSFLNLPYHAASNTVRYAFDDNGNQLSLEDFFKLYDKHALEEKDLFKIKVDNADNDNDMLKGAPPCLVTLLKDGIPEGKRNDMMYNIGVYLKKRYPNDWGNKIYIYNEQFMKPPLQSSEMEALKGSVSKKEYQYKCKQDPIVSFCEPNICSKREFGIGDNTPPPEITEIRKYPSDPPIFFVSLDGDSVEVDSSTLHDPEKFSMACMEQINKPLMPVGKIIWRKMLTKLFASIKEEKAPDSSKIDVQIKELLGDFINKAPGKKFEDIKRGLPFTEDEFTYFKFKDLWKYLQRSKAWPDKNYPKQKTLRMLDTLFSAIETNIKIDGTSSRVMKMETVKLEKPNIRITKMKEAPFL